MKIQIETRAELIARRTVSRFWKKVNKMPGDGCWLWKGYLSHGYGRFAADGQKWRAHRFAYSLLVGPVPEGMVIDHLCRVKSCVRPEHLEATTQGENVRRGELGKGRNRGERCGTAKLAPEQVMEIRERYASGLPRQRDLAAEFGVSQMTISLIVRGKQWAHLSPNLFHSEPPKVA